MRLKLITAIGMLALAAMAKPTLAQECINYCYREASFDETCPCIAGWHKTWDGLFSDRTGNIHACMEGEGGHGSCFADDQDAGALPAYEKILAAARRNDVDRVLKLAGDLPDYVLVNRERSMVMVLSCGGKTFVSALRFTDASSTTKLVAQLEVLQARRALLAAALMPHRRTGM